MPVIPPLKVTVEVVMVAGFISSEKPAVTTVPRAAPVAALAGFTPSTVGAVVSAAPEGVLKGKGGVGGKAVPVLLCVAGSTLTT